MAVDDELARKLQDLEMLHSRHDAAQAATEKIVAK